MSTIATYEVKSAGDNITCALTGIPVGTHTAGLWINSSFLSLLGLKSVGVTEIYTQDRITIHSLAERTKCDECGETTEVAVLDGQGTLESSLNICQSCLQSLSEETVEFISENPETVLTDVIF